MSLHVNWLAVQSSDKDALLAHLGFRETGWANDELRARLACSVLPNGWTVIVSSDYGLKLDRLLPPASARGSRERETATDVEVAEAVKLVRRPHIGRQLAGRLHPRPLISRDLKTCCARPWKGLPDARSARKPSAATPPKVGRAQTFFINSLRRTP